MTKPCTRTAQITATPRWWRLVPLLVVASGCVTTYPQEDPVLIKLTELETRLIKVERTLQNESLLEIMNQLQGLQREVRELRGEIETSANDLEGVRGRQRDLYVELDGRLTALERSTGGAPPLPVQVGDPAAGAGAGAAVTTGPDDAQVYESAFELLKQGRYEQAEQGFRQLLEGSPDSRYADNAQYWLAETWYVRRDFAKALPEFTTLVDRYPRSSKVPDAMLKVGFCQYELGQWQPARAALEQLTERFPDTTAARVARERLDRMRREGR